MGPVRYPSTKTGVKIRKSNDPLRHFSVGFALLVSIMAPIMGVLYANRSPETIGSETGCILLLCG